MAEAAPAQPEAEAIPLSAPPALTRVQLRAAERAAAEQAEQDDPRSDAPEQVDPERFDAAAERSVEDVAERAVEQAQPAQSQPFLTRSQLRAAQREAVEQAAADRALRSVRTEPVRRGDGHGRRRAVAVVAAVAALGGGGATVAAAALPSSASDRAAASSQGRIGDVETAPQIQPAVAQRDDAFRMVGVSRSQERGPIDGCDGKRPRTHYANGQLPLDELCVLPFAPAHRLRGDAAVALIRLNAVYKANFNADLCLTDSYRSLGSQYSLAARKPGLAARPGTSEHGWGLAIDTCQGPDQVGSARREWLLRNAPAFGWDNPAWARPDTGSKPEPWHWEYVKGE